jgi:glycosyltransferase involved in cell wall biosynthesis
MQSQSLKVLYTRRKWFKGWTRESIKKYYEAWRNRKEFVDQDGFFEAALFSSCEVDSKPIEWVLNNRDFINSHYDIVVVNSKFHKEGIILKHFEWIDLLKIPAVLFCGNAMAHRLPSDEILDKFDLIYKRELLYNINNYDISDKNQQKLRTTMLSCPIVRIKRTDPIQHGDIPDPRKTTDPYKYDIFFSGNIRTNKNRKMIVERLRQESFVFYGGLYYQKQKTNKYKQRRLKLDEYKSAIKNSRINLALDGWGQFTFRHLEIWCLGGFCLSTPSIRDVTLPFANPQEGIHYVAFDDPDDMIDKIKYYLTHDEERETIAQAGRAFFEQIYDPIGHGKEIEKELQLLIK